ncbi:MAG: hypothetical protein R2824_15765 [Saprospiraceae bacterium]
MEIQKLKNTAKEYLIARKKFLDIANDTIELSGNDNIIGRIGEFIAYQLLKSQGRCPTKIRMQEERGA